jgi:hypothetical protein
MSQVRVDRKAKGTTIQSTNRRHAVMLAAVIPTAKRWAAVTMVARA